MIQLDSKGLELIIRTVMGEAIGESDTGKAAVVHVILNRLAQPKRFADPRVEGTNLEKVILKPAAFEALKNGGNTQFKKSKDSEDYINTAKIVQGVLTGNIPDPTGGADHYFANKGKHKVLEVPPWWDEVSAKSKGQGVQLGNHIFNGSFPEVKYYGGTFVLPPNAPLGRPSEIFASEKVPTINNPKEMTTANQQDSYDQLILQALSEGNNGAASSASGGAPINPDGSATMADVEKLLTDVFSEEAVTKANKQLALDNPEMKVIVPGNNRGTDKIMRKEYNTGTPNVKGQIASFLDYVNNQQGENIPEVISTQNKADLLFNAINSNVGKPNAMLNKMGLGPGAMGGVQQGLKDTVPAMLTPGEAVIPAEAAQHPKYKPQIKKIIEAGREMQEEEEEIIPKLSSSQLQLNKLKESQVYDPHPELSNTGNRQMDQVINARRSGDMSLVPMWNPKKIPSGGGPGEPYQYSMRGQGDFVEVRNRGEAEDLLTDGVHVVDTDGKVRKAGLNEDEIFKEETFDINGVLTSGKELFNSALSVLGFTQQDAMRFMLYYAGGRLSGGSHNGSFAWSGKQILADKTNALKAQATAGNAMADNVRADISALRTQFEAKKDIYSGAHQLAIQQELSAAFAIRSIPSMLFCPMNEAPQMANGALPKPQLEQIIKDVLKVEK